MEIKQLFFMILTLLLPLLPETVSKQTKSELVNILLEAKTKLVDIDGQLTGWNHSTRHCSWNGVQCNAISGDVISINLYGYNLLGAFPSFFCNITTLTNLSLGFNYLGTALRSGDMAPCRHLRHLDLSDNSFVGSMPEIEVEFPNLLYFGLNQNYLNGTIPESYGWRFPSLRVLNLHDNNATGPIPRSLGNLSQLVELHLDNNPLACALPPEFGKLRNLEKIHLTHSDMQGLIPDSLGNLDKLKLLDLSNNEFNGTIPESLGNLKSIEEMYLYFNQLTGDLPKSFGRLLKLQKFDASSNNLTGTIPEEFAGLQLYMLGLNDNQLEGRIPPSICNSTNLCELKLFNNKLSGEIPLSLGLYSKLNSIDVSGNNLTGPLPPDLCGGGSLTNLIAFSNRLSGSVPESYCACRSLSAVRIGNNMLSGVVPHCFWGLAKIYELEMNRNRLEGPIPSFISGAATSLTKLLISSNRFTGAIPPEICRLSELTMFEAAHNQFTGQLPDCFSNLYKLQLFNLQNNLLSGPIPVGHWPDLTQLNLSSNSFSGKIPSRLSELPVLTYLDLSNNKLTGTIPPELISTNLEILNLSNNLLFGSIPFGFDNRLYAAALTGNPDLCSPSGLLPFPKCNKKKRLLGTRTVVTTGALLAIALVLLVILVCLYNIDRLRNKTRKSSPVWRMTSFSRVRINESEILNSLINENLIGSGGSGQVYRANLRSGQTLAVKRLRTGLTRPDVDRDFEAEVETLSRVRHANIVKLLFCCTTEDFKVLVYEYMENGSLANALHSKESTKETMLDWDRRASIAVDAAKGLAYLHHDCVPPVVHHDVKPSNILLDSEYRAHVGDFGLARAWQGGTEETAEVITVNIAGSCGYIAPEYAYSLKLNEKCDVYSFGVVLLELVTGMKAIDPSFGNDKDLVGFVSDVLSSGRANEVVGFDFLIDPKLHPMSSHQYEEMVKFLHVGIMCTSSTPMSRPSMRRVVELLKDRRADARFFVSTSQKN